MKTRLLLFLAAAAAIVMLSSCDTVEWNDPGLLVPLTVDEDPVLPSIVVNGTRLHAETFGSPDDPMLVVLHGGPGGDYRGMLKCSTLATQGYFVVFYDQRGSGLSRRHNRDIYTPQIFIDDLGAVIQLYRKPGQKVILLGLSWGAMLATAYVNQHPSTINGVILMEPGGFTWNDAEAYIKRTRALDIFDESSNDVVYIDQFVTGSDHNVLDYKAGLQSAAEFAQGNALGNPGPSPFWRMGAVCASASLEHARAYPFDFTGHLRQYTNSVLFLFSEKNKAYGRSHAERVSSAYPRVQLVEIKHTGHDMIYFGWEGIVPVVNAYLDTVQ